jgi:uncharacterized protein YndB with AHSA1/START domain/catechol 2,3-dioxygenase-like lactoylglutathione lyase family enzyme
MNESITRPPVAKAEMLIRKPAAKVFEAFVDPDVTTHFWFTKSSGRLEVGREFRWEWEMYGASTSVLVKALEPGKRILIEWDGYSGRTTVEWTFSARDEDSTTLVAVTETGWTGNGDELVAYAVESTQGFTWTLAGLKAFLEHGLELGLVADKNPDALVSGTPKVRANENAALQNSPMYAYLPAQDVVRARNFYEGTLGFKPAEALDDGVTYRFGNDTACFLYATPHAGTSKASQAFWQVEDVEREVAELQSRGVQFERYDAMPGKRSRDGLVIEDGGAKAAWFKDTEGNILAIVQDV